MSLESWKAEFYPIEAKDCPKKQAAQHSLQKWIGLRKENLLKHGVQNLNSILRYYLDYFSITASTCALCHYYINEPDCTECPLYTVNGMIRCDYKNKENVNLYWQFIVKNDPEPMIEALQRAVQLEEQEKANA